MNTNQEYTGKHKVILPVGFMNSIEAVCELHEEEMAAIGSDLNCPGLRLSLMQKLTRRTVVGLCIWLIPAIWLTCL